MRKMKFFFLAIFIYYSVALAQVTWIETSQSDFADGWIDPNLYVSFRANLESDSGAIEWFSRFDLDGNGYADFVSVDHNWPYFLRIWYMGATGLDSSQYLPMGGPGGNCDYADLNVDGFTEIIHSGYLTHNLSIYWSTLGSFSATDTTNFYNNNSEATYVADFDKDGYLDIAVSNFNFYIYWGSSGGIHGWEVCDTTTLHIGSGTAHNLESADFDRDGDLDIVIYASNIFIARNEGGRTFTLHTIPGIRMVGCHGLSVGDIDNDNDIDIVATSRNFPPDPTVILFNDGAGNFTDSMKIFPGSSYGGSALYDFNGDNWLDILFFRGVPGGMLRIYPNIGPPSLFLDATSYTIGPYPVNSSGGTVIDANRDGNVDIFLNNYVNGYSLLLWGPSFSTCDSFPVSMDHHGIFREPGNIRDRSQSAWYESNIFDTYFELGISSGIVYWDAYDEKDYDTTWILPKPEGAEVIVLARTGNTPFPDITWTEWDTLFGDDSLPSSILGNRYIQYRAELWYENPANLPWLEKIEFEFISLTPLQLSFAEETDCDDRNIVEICYEISGDSVPYDVQLHLSLDSGI